MFTADARMPAGGPQTVLDVLSTFNPQVREKKSSIDLSRTYTSRLVDNAQ